MSYPTPLWGIHLPVTALALSARGLDKRGSHFKTCKEARGLDKSRPGHIRLQIVFYKDQKPKGLSGPSNRSLNRSSSSFFSSLERKFCIRQRLTRIIFLTESPDFIIDSPHFLFTHHPSPIDHHSVSLSSQSTNIFSGKNS